MAFIAYLDRSKAYVRTLFMDFSSTFNLIQPHILLGKLRGMNVNPYLILWINDFLTNRSQRVRLMQSVSDIVYTNIGAPQGCVLSPVLFTLYTSDLRCNNATCSMVKYADDTWLPGFITHEDETGYRDEITKFVHWCRENLPVLNAQKN